MAIDIEYLRDPQNQKEGKDINDRLRRLALRRDPDGLERSGLTHADQLAQAKEMIRTKMPEIDAKLKRMFASARCNAAGILCYALDTKKFLIVKRSPDVGDPNLWCGVGGKIEDGESPEAAARREFWEEVGYNGPMELEKAYVYDKPELYFHNFVGTVPKEFVPQLNWETSEYRWVDLELDGAPEPTHYGLKALLDDQESNRIITEVMANNVMPKAVFASRVPYLAKLGISAEAQMHVPTSELPRAFNAYNQKLWDTAIRETATPAGKKESSTEAWGRAIVRYIDLCQEQQKYPFSSMHSGVNDFIQSDLNSLRKHIVKFFNFTNMLKQAQLGKSVHNIHLLTDGFVIEVYNKARITDPTFAKWLTTSPSPRFNIMRENNRYVRELSPRLKMIVSNEGANLDGRWRIGYEIKIPRLPDIPNNNMPSASELREFILNVMYMPILLGNRPNGYNHRLI